MSFLYILIPLCVCIFLNHTSLSGLIVCILLFVFCLLYFTYKLEKTKLINKYTLNSCLLSFISDFFKYYFQSSKSQSPFNMLFVVHSLSYYQLLTFIILSLSLLIRVKVYFLLSIDVVGHER